MEHNIPLLTTLAAGFGIALILGFIAERIKVPALVGYLVAGILIGPATPVFVADVHIRTGPGAAAAAGRCAGRRGIGRRRRAAVEHHWPDAARGVGFHRIDADRRPPRIAVAAVEDRLSHEFCDASLEFHGLFTPVLPVFAFSQLATTNF